MNLPLQGITVVEFGGNVAGPYAGLILAELGAEVIKIERAGSGDDARGWGPPFWNDASTFFHGINRNKKSVAADFNDPATVAKLKQLIMERADVVVQNLRTGALEKFGLGGEELTKAKPELIYCNLSAFGRVGPMADRPGFDALLQAYGGVVAVTGEEGANPVRCGISVLDMGSGMWCAIGILAAINRRNATGKGGLVDGSLFETALAWNSIYLADYQLTGENPKKSGTGARNITPYRGFTCSDGHLLVAAPNDRLFQRLAAALERPAWAEDEKFRSSPARAENKDELNALIDAVMMGESRQHWRTLLDAAGIPNAPIQEISEVMTDPQTEAVGMMQATNDPNLKLAGLPLQFDNERPELRNIISPLGADTEEVFAGLEG